MGTVNAKNRRRWRSAPTGRATMARPHEWQSARRSSCGVILPLLLPAAARADEIGAARGDRMCEGERERIRVIRRREPAEAHVFLRLEVDLAVEPRLGLHADQ